ncbi:hypothetical protein PROFUN_03516 [Planoprotostelium fungivorum]|uniref:Uncharacterized protein n=1 Tax=Planoprotostelium fungivorum TaxID=1890364 RepID=A0A2P6MNE4_9EUKA|nr:hypothetical protein PROFUN_03516 [Planoprotostelium fungivorum]
MQEHQMQLREAKRRVQQFQIYLYHCSRWNQGQCANLPSSMLTTPLPPKLLESKTEMGPPLVPCYKRTKEWNVKDMRQLRKVLKTYRETMEQRRPRWYTLPERPNQKFDKASILDMYIWKERGGLYVSL